MMGSPRVEVPFTAGRVVSLKERDTTVVKDGDGGGEEWQRSLFKAWINPQNKT